MIVINVKTFTFGKNGGTVRCPFCSRTVYCEPHMVFTSYSGAAIRGRPVPTIIYTADALVLHDCEDQREIWCIECNGFCQVYADRKHKHRCSTCGSHRLQMRDLIPT